MGDTWKQKSDSRRELSFFTLLNMNINKVAHRFSALVKEKDYECFL